jgi:predicted HD phosphohydrolase
VTLSELLDLLVDLGDAPGETDGLSELDHGLQCADELRRARPHDTELQLAGLVHDIGHQFGHDEDHGTLGAAKVRRLLGDRVAALVEAHVPAKRFLVTTDPAYGTTLSPVSTISLGVQGGTMSEHEVEVFHRSPYRDDAVMLRRADELAKVPGRSVPPLDPWVPLLTRLAQTQHPRPGHS